MADKGYLDSSCVTPDKIPESFRAWHKEIRDRHENVNKRIKQFSTVSAVFRHNRDLHVHFLFACANLAQLMITNGVQVCTIDSIK